MEVFVKLMICLALPACVGVALAVGSKALELLREHVPPLRAWADREIEWMECQEEEE